MNVEIDNHGEKSIQKSFKNIADTILNEHILEVKDKNNKLKRYRVINIEFYYYSKNIHEDIYTHGYNHKRGKDRQELSNEWYLHHISINKGARNGLDWTIGNGLDFGGILIKEVICLDDCRHLTQAKFINELIDILKPINKNNVLNKIETQNLINWKKLKKPYQDKPIPYKRKGLKPKNPICKYQDYKYAYKIEKYYK